jgi:hypothetical protein
VTSSVSGGVETYQLTATVSVSPTSVNRGTSSTLSIALNGTSPWDITYSDGTNTVSSYGVATSPKTFTVTPTTTTTYSISSLVDGKYCQAFPSSTATLTVVQPSAPTIGSITQPTCATSTGYGRFKWITSKWNIVLLLLQGVQQSQVQVPRPILQD